MSPLITTFDSIGRPRILVLGDLILDRYTWGEAERVSPEAPVLVLRVETRELRLGGAASVAMLLRGLEADVTLAGVVGDDSEGRALVSLLRDDQIDSDLVLIDPDRPTTTKERFLGRGASRSAGGGQQMLRVDHESRAPVTSSLAEPLVAGILERLGDFQAVLVSDYAKGVCTSRILQPVIAAAKERRIPLLVDPARIPEFAVYHGATLLKPNRLEAGMATGLAMETPEAALSAGRQLCRELDLDAVVVTLDWEGMALVRPDGSQLLFSTRPRSVYDITGAGDIVLAALGLCLASRIDVPPSVAIANAAAGLEVERLGVSSVTRAELRSALQDTPLPTVKARTDRTDEQGLGTGTEACPGDPNSTFRTPHTAKLTTSSEIASLVESYRRTGKTIVFTNGCFDLLHVGHVTMLSEAAACGDVLIVAVNGDVSVRRLKGSGRPVINERERAAMLASLDCVDHVIVFDDPTPHRLLSAIRPDTLVKGGTTDQIIGREIVESYGGHACHVSQIDGVSTTAILSRISDS